MSEPEVETESTSDDPFEHLLNMARLYAASIDGTKFEIKRAGQAADRLKRAAIRYARSTEARDRLHTANRLLDEARQFVDDATWRKRAESYLSESSAVSEPKR